MDKIGSFEKAGFNQHKKALLPKAKEDLYGIIPHERSKPYDQYHVDQTLWTMEF